MRENRGVTYFEGTGNWYANENAVKTFCPHGTRVRKYVDFQIRVEKT